MKKEKIGKRSLRWTRARSARVCGIVLITIVAVCGVAWGMFGQTPSTTPTPLGSSSVFTPGHSSFSQAFKHFFNIKPEPVQPIAYTHKVHVTDNHFECTICHVGVEKGPVASIPGVTKCMECHEYTATEKPEIQKIAEYQKKNLEIPWQRVYGWPEESHVRFNHAPHIRAKVDCAKCHGDIPTMTVARRVVNHSMGFCVKCHEQNKVSNDCMTCHF